MLYDSSPRKSIPRDVSVGFRNRPLSSTFDFPQIEGKKRNREKKIGSIGVDTRSRRCFLGKIVGVFFLTFFVFKMNDDPSLSISSPLTSSRHENRH